MLKHCVKEKFVLRIIISVSKEISLEAYNDHLDVNSILDKAEQKLFDISQKTQLNQFTNIESLLTDVLDKWSNRKKIQAAF